MGAIAAPIRIAGAAVASPIYGVASVAVNATATISTKLTSTVSANVQANGAINASAVISTTLTSAVSATGQITSAPVDSVSATGHIVTVLGGQVTAAVTVVSAPVEIASTATIVSVLGSGVRAQAIVGSVADTLLQLGRRIIPVGTRQTPLKLQVMDVDEVDDLSFRCGPALLPGEHIVDAVVTCESRVGADINAPAVLVGSWQISGAFVLQRVHATVPGMTYLVRALVTLNSGRKLLGQAYLPVVRM